MLLHLDPLSTVRARSVASPPQTQVVRSKVAAVHIPDGFFNAGTSLAAGPVAAGGIAVALRRTREVLGERHVPLASPTAAFVFSAQILNFPGAHGPRGPLQGGVLPS